MAEYYMDKTLADICESIKANTNFILKPDDQLTAVEKLDNQANVEDIGDLLPALTTIAENYMTTGSMHLRANSPDSGNSTENTNMNIVKASNCLFFAKALKEECDEIKTKLDGFDDKNGDYAELRDYINEKIDKIEEAAKGISDIEYPGDDIESISKSNLDSLPDDIKEKIADIGSNFLPFSRDEDGNVVVNRALEVNPNMSVTDGFGIDVNGDFTGPFGSDNTGEFSAEYIDNMKDSFEKYASVLNEAAESKGLTKLSTEDIETIKDCFNMRSYDQQRHVLQDYKSLNRNAETALSKYVDLQQKCVFGTDYDGEPIDDDKLERMMTSTADVLGTVDEESSGFRPGSAPVDITGTYGEATVATGIDDRSTPEEKAFERAEAEKHGKSVGWGLTGDPETDSFIRKRNDCISKGGLMPTYRNNPVYLMNTLAALISAKSKNLKIDGKKPSGLDIILAIDALIHWNPLDFAAKAILGACIDGLAAAWHSYAGLDKEDVRKEIDIENLGESIKNGVAKLTTLDKDSDEFKSKLSEVNGFCKSMIERGSGSGESIGKMAYAIYSGLREGRSAERTRNAKDAIFGAGEYRVDGRNILVDLSGALSDLTRDKQESDFRVSGENGLYRVSNGVDREHSNERVAISTNDNYSEKKSGFRGSLVKYNDGSTEIKASRQLKDADGRVVGSENKVESRKENGDFSSVKDKIEGSIRTRTEESKEGEIYKSGKTIIEPRQNNIDHIERSDFEKNGNTVTKNSREITQVSRDTGRVTYHATFEGKDLTRSQEFDSNGKLIKEKDNTDPKYNVVRTLGEDGNMIKVVSDKEGKFIERNIEKDGTDKKESDKTTSDKKEPKTPEEVEQDKPDNTTSDDKNPKDPEEIDQDKPDDTASDEKEPKGPENIDHDESDDTTSNDKDPKEPEETEQDKPDDAAADNENEEESEDVDQKEPDETISDNEEPKDPEETDQDKADDTTADGENKEPEDVDQNKPDETTSDDEEPRDLEETDQDKPDGTTSDGEDKESGDVDQNKSDETTSDGEEPKEQEEVDQNNPDETTSDNREPKEPEEVGTDKPESVASNDGSQKDPTDKPVSADSEKPEQIENPPESDVDQKHDAPANESDKTDSNDRSNNIISESSYDRPSGDTVKIATETDKDGNFLNVTKAIERPDGTRSSVTHDSEGNTTKEYASGVTSKIEDTDTGSKETFFKDGKEIGSLETEGNSYTVKDTDGNRIETDPTEWKADITGEEKGFDIDENTKDEFNDSVSKEMEQPVDTFLHGDGKIENASENIKSIADKAEAGKMSPLEVGGSLINAVGNVTDNPVDLADDSPVRGKVQELFSNIGNMIDRIGSIDIDSIKALAGAVLKGVCAVAAAIGIEIGMAGAGGAVDVKAADFATQPAYESVQDMDIPDQDDILDNTNTSPEIGTDDNQIDDQQNNMNLQDTEQIPDYQPIFASDLNQEQNAPDANDAMTKKNEDSDVSQAAAALSDIPVRESDTPDVSEAYTNAAQEADLNIDSPIDLESMHSNLTADVVGNTAPNIETPVDLESMNREVEIPVNNNNADVSDVAAVLSEAEEAPKQDIPDVQPVENTGTAAPVEQALDEPTADVSSDAASGNADFPSDAGFDQENNIFDTSDTNMNFGPDISQDAPVAAEDAFANSSANMNFAQDYAPAEDIPVDYTGFQEAADSYFNDDAFEFSDFLDSPITINGEQMGIGEAITNGNISDDMLVTLLSDSVSEHLNDPSAYDNQAAFVTDLQNESGYGNLAQDMFTNFENSGSGVSQENMEGLSGALLDVSMDMSQPNLYYSNSDVTNDLLEIENNINQDISSYDISLDIELAPTQNDFGVQDMEAYRPEDQGIENNGLPDNSGNVENHNNDPDMFDGYRPENDFEKKPDMPESSFDVDDRIDLGGLI